MAITKKLREQYFRARKHSAIFDISDREKLVLSGKDHLKFLQGMLTNDVLKLRAGEGIGALMLNQKGRILADMRLFRKDSETHLDLEAATAGKTMRLMNDFKLSYKVEIEKKEDRALFHLAGPEAPKIFSQFFQRDAEAMNRFDHFEGSVAGAHVWTARVDRTGKTGFDIETAPENSGKTLEAFVEKGVSHAGPEVLEIMRIEAAIPKYGTDMDESVIAPETGLMSAISFDKGCYVGQEIVARAHWRGRINRHFSAFVFSGEKPPPGGSEIISEQGAVIGRVTSSAFSPPAGSIAVGYIRREFKSPGTVIKTGAGQEGKVAPVHSGDRSLTEK